MDTTELYKIRHIIESLAMYGVNNAEVNDYEDALICFEKIIKYSNEAIDIIKNDFGKDGK
jgi:hypothetical protein